MGIRVARTVRGRLALFYGASLALVLLAYAAAVFLFLRQRLFAEVDAGIRERIEHEMAELALGMAVGLPIAVAVAVAGGYYLARRALSPVSRMADRANAIHAGRLSERLPVGGAGDEIDRLATAFNTMLARLEASFETLRRFSSDAAHELRTPLAAVRSVGEVALAAPGREAELRESIGSMLEEIDRLSGLVETLLDLTRSDAGQLPVRSVEFDLGEIASASSDLLQALAEEKRVSISVEREGTVRVRADPELLRRALVNLLDNAIRVSPEGSRIRIRVRAERARCVVEVIDEGPGIPPAFGERVFERFFRIDPGRTRERGGCGLGLSIARSAVEANGGRIELDSEPGRGSVFRIVLPPVYDAGAR